MAQLTEHDKELQREVKAARVSGSKALACKEQGFGYGTGRLLTPKGYRRDENGTIRRIEASR